ncbi:hypothetical protein B0A52_02154 [Exophiala mesophila]|uniref:CN hydrolase domain-containing protein n=1 Tax=Exophiala mesophila TaxID=212818 RepID=A0A438NBM0_EXOME|nr:hypothetical protein B0A52_02154 [Exophiala mesophila]
MPSILKVAVGQANTKPTQQETLEALATIVRDAAAKGVDLILFPEGYIGGYPRTTNFGVAMGSRSEEGRDQFWQYFKSAADLGDTPQGAGDDYIKKSLPVNEKTGRRGDGTREFLEDVAKQTGVFIASGVIEKAGGTLYCSVVFIDPTRGLIGKRRKLMPTGSERLVWGFGTAATLRAVTTTIKGVELRIGCAICWENYMPLLRQSLYQQNINLYLAPTADTREVWPSLMRVVAHEGRSWVISGNLCQTRAQLPKWITGDLNGDEGKSEYVSKGGSTIVSPFGDVVAGPVWEEERLLIADIDFDECERGRLDFDSAGHYSRSDQFQLTAVGLDLIPPP